MKKILLLLSAGALLAACDSGYKPDGPDQVNAEKKAAAAEKPDALNQDSTTGANVTAVAHQPQVDTSNTKIGTAPTGSPQAKGAKLMAAADCASCHREREKLIGPAYVDVAKKYSATTANVSMLAGRVISGGQGHWGEVPMTPHPGLAQSDAQEMVRYILSLK